VGAPTYTAPAAAAPLPSGKLLNGAAHYRIHLALWDVYVVDILGIGHGGTHARRRDKRALLHTMDIMLHPLEITDSAHEWCREGLTPGAVSNVPFCTRWTS
jgi:hypothetical protein